MNNKIISTTRNQNIKVHGSSFSKKYSRVDIENSYTEKLPYDHDLKQINSLSFNNSKVFYLSKPFKLVKCGVSLKKIHGYNPIIIYRILKGIYGKLDSNIIVKLEELTRPIPIGWSIMVSNNKGMYFDFLDNYNNNGVCVNILTENLCSKDEFLANNTQSIKEFFNDLESLIGNNLHLFSEESEIKYANSISDDLGLVSKLTGNMGIYNVFYLKYIAAKKIHDLAIKSECSPIDSTIGNGYLFYCAGILYIIAFESFLNMIYHFFLREEFRDNRINKIMKHSDYDIKLSAIHIFCNYFESQPFEKNDPLLKDVFSLRDLRNEIFHGNITDEHKIYNFIEDIHFFSYIPHECYRGRTIENKRQFNSHIFQFGEIQIDKIVEIIDKSIDKIINSLSNEKRNFVKSWKESQIVLDNEI